RPDGGRPALAARAPAHASLRGCPRSRLRCFRSDGAAADRRHRTSVRGDDHLLLDPARHGHDPARAARSGAAARSHARGRLRAGWLDAYRSPRPRGSARDAVHALHLVQEGLDITHEPSLLRTDLLVRPLPPSQREQALAGLAVEAVAHNPCRIAGDDRVRGNGLGHDRPRAHYGAIADSQPGQHRRALADPDIVADDRRSLVHVVRRVPFAAVEEDRVEREGRSPGDDVCTAAVDSRLVVNRAERADDDASAFGEDRKGVLTEADGVTPNLNAARNRRTLGFTG